MSLYSRGDIVLIPFPFTDLSGNKVRPAIVISNSHVNKTSDLILAQITSNRKEDEFSFEIKDKDVTRSMQGYSEIRCHKIFTGKKEIIRKKISSLRDSSQTALYEKIISFFN